MLEIIKVGVMGVNCYVTGEKNEAIIIDPGASAEKILGVLEYNNIKVKYIVLTHCHFDHILAVNEIKEKTGAKIVASKKECENLKNPDINMTGMYSRKPLSIVPDVLVSDDDKITSGSYEYTVIETPGHTSGGICLYCKEENNLFSGDTLFCTSIGRCDLPTGEYDTLINSIKTKLLCLPDNTNVFPGHEDTTTVLYEKRNNPYLR